jgi:hypothetical protein
MILFKDGAMRRTRIVGVPASSFLLGICCVLGFGQAGKHYSAAKGPSLPGAVIAYGFLRSNYVDFDKLLKSDSRFAAVRDMKALQATLDSLGCDVTVRLAFPHRDLIVESSSGTQWTGVPTKGLTPQEEGTLFVLQPLPANPQRTWAVLSSVAPERTTVLWIEARERGYVSTLVYDSFTKGKIKNAAGTVIGSVISVRVDESGEILLKERAEPGSRPHAMGETGRVFEVDVTQYDVTLKTSGALPESERTCEVTPY